MGDDINFKNKSYIAVSFNKFKALNKRWLYFIVVAGLIPVLLRLLLWYFFAKSDASLITSVSSNDLAGFGLALNITNILEVMDKSSVVEKVEKIGVCILLILLFSLFYFIGTVFEFKEELAVLNKKIMLLSILASVTLASMYYSYSIFKLTEVSKK